MKRIEVSRRNKEKKKTNAISSRVTIAETIKETKSPMKTSDFSCIAKNVLEGRRLRCLTDCHERKPYTLSFGASESTNIGKNNSLKLRTNVVCETCGSRRRPRVQLNLQQPQQSK
ncbi:hypothetical protein QLX08_000746 [Tetragonisca angustula]|uniref:Uncharacterized protein n=1 Tax=Tetragonisca angustula TaxID=166442 RepID=A0AAW1AIJ1_9HYME